MAYIVQFAYEELMELARILEMDIGVFQDELDRSDPSSPATQLLRDRLEITKRLLERVRLSETASTL